MAVEDMVLAAVRDDVLWLTINREPARNALNDAVLERLAGLFDESRGDARLRAIVLTGAGNRAFCAGGDMKSGSATFEFDHSRPSTTYADLMRAAGRSDLPIIARVNGHCLAGGMGLLAMSDMAVAVDTARFGLPEVKVGLFPMQVAAMLRRIMPARAFAELCFAGESITADEARSLGLLNHVVPPAELDAKLAWMLGRISAAAPTAIRRGKYALRATQDMTLEQALAYMEAQLATLALTEDAREGLEAFNQKRAPVWKGR
jgi:methylglutaconyl-CoA hydratase